MGFLDKTLMTELDNGVRLCYFHRPGTSVEMQLHIASGSIHEGKFLGCGVSHFLEHMAFQGCAGFPERSIAEKVNSLGGDLNAYTSYDRTCYRMQLPQEYWSQAAQMLSAMVRFPELPEKRFVEERNVILRECERCMDDPGRRLHEKFMRTMFLQHPLRYPVIGFPEMISGVSREMALEYHHQRYSPHRCIAVAVGDMVPDEFFSVMNDLLGDWKRTNLAEPVFPEEALPASLRSSELIFSDPLERFCYGMRGPGFGTDELPAVELLFGILGTGDSSILNQTLVLNKSLAVGVRSFCYTVGGVSLAGISGKTIPGKSTAFRSALQKELEMAARGNFSAARMEREKGQQYADHLRELRDPVNIAGEIAGGVLYDNSPEAGDTYLNNLCRTQVEEIRKAAEKYLNLSHWVCVHQHSGRRIIAAKTTDKTPKLDSWQSVSGNKVVYAPDHLLPLCNLVMVLPGGALHEPEGFYGISRLLAATLTAGAGKFRENTLLRKLDELGVELGVSAGANSIVLELSAPSRRMSGAISLLRDILSAPRFEPGAVDREIHRCLESIKERGVDPVKSAWDCGLQMLYGKHPYAFSKCGKSDDIARLTRNDLLKYYSKCIAPGSWIIGIGGDCSRDEAAKWSTLLEDAQRPVTEMLTRPEWKGFPEKCCSRQLLLDREQTVVMRMIPGLECAGDADMLDIFEILSQAENGLASTLFKQVREERALSYSVGMNFFSGFHPGAVTFYAMTVAGAENEVMQLLNNEIRRLGEDGLSEEEFEAAKSGVLFDIGRIFDSPEILLHTAVMDAYYGRSPLDVLTRRDKINSLTREDFNLKIKKYFISPAGGEIKVLAADKNE